MEEREFYQKLIDELKAENSALLEIILTQQGLLDQKVIVGENVTSNPVGKEPWYIKKKRLEHLYSKKED